MTLFPAAYSSSDTVFGGSNMLSVTALGEGPVFDQCLRENFFLNPLSDATGMQRGLGGFQLADLGSLGQPKREFLPQLLAVAQRNQAEQDKHASEISTPCISQAQKEAQSSASAASGDTSTQQQKTEFSEKTSPSWGCALDEYGLPKRRRGRPTKAETEQRTQQLKELGYDVDPFTGMGIGTEVYQGAIQHEEIATVSISAEKAEELGLPKRKRGRPTKEETLEREELLRSKGIQPSKLGLTASGLHCSRSQPPVLRRHHQHATAASSQIDAKKGGVDPATKAQGTFSSQMGVQGFSGFQKPFVSSHQQRKGSDAPSKSVHWGSSQSLAGGASQVAIRGGYANMQRAVDHDHSVSAMGLLQPPAQCVDGLEEGLQVRNTAQPLPTGEQNYSSMYLPHQHFLHAQQYHASSSFHLIHPQATRQVPVDGPRISYSTASMMAPSAATASSSGFQPARVSHFSPVVVADCKNTNQQQLQQSAAVFAPLPLPLQFQPSQQHRYVYQLPTRPALLSTSILSANGTVNSNNDCTSTNLEQLKKYQEPLKPSPSKPPVQYHLPITNSFASYGPALDQQRLPSKEKLSSVQSICGGGGSSKEACSHDNSSNNDNISNKCTDNSNVRANRINSLISHPGEKIPVQFLVNPIVESCASN